MSLEAFLGLESQQSSKEFNKLAKLTSLEHDELEQDGLIKEQLPMLQATDKIKIPRVVDEFTGRKISLNFDKGTTTLAFLYKNGIVVCADSRATGGQYIGSQGVRKIIPINKFLLGTMAGGAADCTYWERLLSERCRLYELRNREPISVAAASKLLANMLYNYRGMGLSLGVMICGWDHKKGPKIYMVDNDSRRVPGTLFSVGSGSVFAYGVLDKSYRFDMTDEEAYDLGRRAIYHATHRDAYSGGIIRVYSIQKDGWKIISEDDNTVLHDRYVAEGSVSMDH
uniref:Proteasome subunit beta n=1 Tax=Aceria tosichella TaxID=561515 RepID=A0A6G1SIW8_9ACAR